MTDIINYGQLMHQAMRGLLRSVLRDVAKSGLPGKHHFMITFQTTADGVDIPDWLIERYPDEMTIVMQEWFADLKVSEDQFTVTLNFGDEPVPMLIPFDAIRTFVDPSVEFGLKFEAVEEVAQDDEEQDSPMIEVDEKEHAAPNKAAEVVSLDNFRKK
ncbi:MAG: hypothetical protein GXP03_05505 [Alphaproteobacteria bacterium]|nr:hypothetical protein [Alphaproteobacteria bacterium]